MAKLRFFQFKDLYKLWQILSNKEKVLAFSLFAILLVTISFSSRNFYVAHTTELPDYGGIYSEAFVGQPRFINPLLAQSQIDKDLSRLVFAGLYKFNSTGALIPDLAAGAVQISKNQKEFTVALKANLKWQDGSDLNADDIIFTIETLQNPKYKSPLQKKWQNTKVSKIDNLTVVFKNKDVSAPFINNLILGILPKHAWQNVDPNNFASSSLNLEPIGSGAYVSKEIDKAPSGEINQYIFNSYKNYYQGRPYIDELDLKFYDNYADALLALHGKEVDAFGYAPFDGQTYNQEQKTNLQIMRLPILTYQALFFNTGNNSKVIGDAAVRTALTKATDRNNLIGSIYNNAADADYGPILPQQLGFDPSVKNINSYDLAAANAILDKAGWNTNAKTGIREKGKNTLSFTITTNDFGLNVQSAQNLIDQWKKIGANVSLNSVSNSDLENKFIRPRNYDALLFGESTGYDPDPFAFWHSSQAKDPGINLSAYKNTKADRLISDARNTFDQNARIQKYSQFQNILLNDAPAIFLDQSNFIYEVAANVHGIALKQLANPEDRFYDIGHWYVATKRIIK